PPQPKVILDTRAALLPIPAWRLLDSLAPPGFGPATFSQKPNLQNGKQPRAVHVPAPWDTPAIARTHWPVANARAPRMRSVAALSRAFAPPPQPDSAATEHSPAQAGRALARGRSLLPSEKIAQRRASYAGPPPTCLVDMRHLGS